MKYIIELETLILAFEEMQVAQNGDCAHNKMLLNALNGKIADLAKVQCFYEDEATTDFQLKLRIAQLAEFRNKLRNIVNYVINLNKHEHTIIKGDNTRYTSFNDAVQAFNKVITQTDATILHLFDILRNIEIEENRLKKLLPKAEPEQGSEGAHDELLEKIMHDNILLPRFKDVIREDDFGKQYILRATQILRKVISVGLEAQAKGKGVKKSHWKNEIKIEIDRYPNGHKLGELDYNELMKGFEYYGIEIDEKTAGRWLTDWRNNK